MSTVVRMACSFMIVFSHACHKYGRPASFALMPPSGVSFCRELGRKPRSNVDNCYTGNFRSQPSNGATPSGKTIVLARMAKQPDDFAKEIIARGEAARAKLK
jgi:hypothetical protein